MLTTCVWSSVNCVSEELIDPGWEDVEGAILALDGASRNDIYLAPDRVLIKPMTG